MRLSVFFKKERSLKNRRHDRASTTLSEYSPGWWYDILSQLLNFFLFLFSVWFSNLKLFYFFPEDPKVLLFPWHVLFPKWISLRLCLRSRHFTRKVDRRARARGCQDRLRCLAPWDRLGRGSAQAVRKKGHRAGSRRGQSDRCDLGRPARGLARASGAA